MNRNETPNQIKARINTVLPCDVVATRRTPARGSGNTQRAIIGAFKHLSENPEKSSVYIVVDNLGNADHVYSDVLDMLGNIVKKATTYSLYRNNLWYY